MTHTVSGPHQHKGTSWSRVLGLIFVGILALLLWTPVIAGARLLFLTYL